MHKAKRNISERRDWFASQRNALDIVDPTKTESRTYTVFSRERLRMYLKNPKQYETTIRELARFLKRYSMQLTRIVNYYANMIDLKAMMVVPNIDLDNEVDDEAISASYMNTLKKLDQMRFENEIFKLLSVCWLEGSAFGYIYDDDKDFFIHNLDGSYCKIYSVYGGICRFAFDFSYFSSREEVVESWAPEFKKKYNSYKSDSSLRWQPLDPENSICIKLDMDDPTLSIPPFLPLFENLISLIDLQSIQDTKDALSIYKLLVAKMETVKGSNSPDDFTVDPDTALAYFDKMLDSIPEQVAAAISPLPIDVVEFKGTTTEDEDRLSASMENLFKASGGSQVLGTDKSGSTIFSAQILADTEYAISSILPQLEKWMNLYLEIKVGDDHAIVRYLDVSSQTRKEKRKELLESGQNGIPVKLTVAALDGFSPLDTIRMAHLENNILRLHENWVPFSTSYTQSSSDNITKDVDNLTDEGIATKEQDKNDM